MSIDNAAPAVDWRWCVAAVGWVALTAAAHLEFSIWLVSPRQTPFGPFAFKALVPWLALVTGGGLLWLAGRQVRAAGLRSHRAIAWAVWLMAVVAVDRWLTYSVNELAHYPQYALLGWLLARALDPRRDRLVAARVLVLATLMGAADEAAQYLWVAATYGDYFDFNDVLVDTLGAALGLLVYYPATACRRWQRPPLPAGTWAAVAGLVLLVGSGFASGRCFVDPPAPVPRGGILRDEAGVPRLYLQREPGAYGSVREGHRHASYRVLSPRQGLLLSGLAVGVFGFLLGGGRRSIDAPMVVSSLTGRGRAADATTPGPMTDHLERGK
ncbi:MAG: VanZ family protein [Rhodocyclaceae bacterium]|nr:VanZ family protein [Rhodocyclaceae bacterium]